MNCNELISKGIIRLDVYSDFNVPIPPCVNVSSINEKYVTLNENKPSLHLALNPIDDDDIEVNSPIKTKSTQSLTHQGMINDITITATSDVDLDVINEEIDKLQYNELLVLLILRDESKAIVHFLPGSDMIKIESQDDDSQSITITISGKSMSSFILIE